ncbi:DNA mismatch repair protein MutL [Encephalitozoon romaleae SJ-2008]|uniref:DNA mismatch repair protein MutL n=1 Tax=Encephalitozoon romaleae (strain SJ-2008) TaxID=1178016 RepID=I6ZWE8_ENCRO|nr:DNA mismatch repair protein MutL [Encephalitozoon romaleae SJ-2008]AFN84096.1 DNA mismatch repair protein MutL [Encephalitozoon romaleae SJ-2008]
MIRKLPEDLGKRIKAQRSVQSTYIVVKELIENSIDSGCTWIRVRIDDSVTVEDNGCGISDLNEVGIEGSTSKESMAYYVLGCVDRVERFSYGFRGQALSSLAEVCDLEIISRSEHPFAFRRDFSANTISKCARERGTTVHVRNLFKNCPLRRCANERSLKKNLAKICSLIESYRCVNKINFTLFHRRKVLLSCGGYETPKEYFESNYPSFSGKYMEVSNGQLEIFMLPVSVRDPKQLMFSEKRPISNKRILNGIKNEFNLYAEGSPTFVLVIKGYGDVNVSTDKSEVIFGDETGILNLLRSEIGRFFSSEAYLHVGNIGETNRGRISRRCDPEENDGEELMGRTLSRMNESLPVIRPARVATSFEVGPRKRNIPPQESVESSKEPIPSEPELFVEKENDKEEDASSSPLEGSEPFPKMDQIEEGHEDGGSFATGAYSFFKHDDLVQPKVSFSKEDFTRMEVIGQFNNGFIISKLKKNDKIYLVAVDQHAADEIRNFESIKKTFRLKKQSVIVPVKLDLTPIEEVIVNDNLELFERNGFVIKNGMLETIPVYKNQVFGVKEFQELLEDMKNDEYEFKRIRNIIASKACRTSVMIGDALSMADMKKIVKSLSFLDRPWKCPHGRPTFMILNEAEM